MVSNTMRVVMVVAVCLTTITAPTEAQRSELPKPALAELDQGQLLLDHREYFQALRRLTRANELSGNKCPECLVGMAEAMYGMKSYQNALDTAAKAIEVADGNVRWVLAAHQARADAFRALAETDPAKYQDAEQELRTSLALDGSSRDAADVRFALGVVLMKQRRDDEGIEELKRVAAARPDAIGDDARALIANPRRARENYAPDFNITTASGARMTLESLHGNVVLVDFWATWCPPCVKAVPAIKKLQKAHAADPFVILSISGDMDDSVWRRFTAKNDMDWPQYWDRGGDFQTHFAVKGLPTYVLLDGEGIERFRVTGSGFHESRALNDAIEKLIAGKPLAPR